MRSVKVLPLCAAGFALVAHLLGNPHYGFFRDELYFIMCGFQPALGYVDQPPLAPLLAAGSQHFGHSLFALRSIPALFTAGSIYVTCLTAIELGGGAFAQALAALVAFLCPVLMAFGTKLSPDMVGLLLWPLTALLVLRVLKGGHPSHWLFAGLALGVSFEAKYSVLFFALALLVALLLSQQRRSLLSPWPLGGVIIAMAIALPNLLWQLHFDFPMLELLANGQRDKNLIVSPGGYLAAQLLITNPILAVVWISGLAWLLRNPTTRFLALAFFVLMPEMIVFHGKNYYPASIYPVLIAAGGVAIESWTDRLRVLRPWIAAFATVAGITLVPYVMPILPVGTFVKFNQLVAPILHIETAKTEKHRDGLLPQDWADMHGWPELAAAIARVYASLSPQEAAKALISTQNYGEAAALEFFGKKYGLPPVISGHNQYYLWGTHGNSGQVLIDVHGDCGKSLGLYQSATLAATFSHPYVMPYENQIPILICRGLKHPLADIWTRIKFYR